MWGILKNKNKAFVGNNEWESQYHLHKILPRGWTPCKLNKCIFVCSLKNDFTHLVEGIFLSVGWVWKKIENHTWLSQFSIWILMLSHWMMPFMKLSYKVSYNVRTGPLKSWSNMYFNFIKPWKGIKKNQGHGFQA